MVSRKDRGSILLAVLIVALVLGITCASLVIFSVANTSASQYGLRRAEALTTAEIGVERAKMSIAEGAFASQFSAQAHQAIAEGSIVSSGGEHYGTYAVHVTERYGGVDQQYLIVSQGTTGTATRQANVVVRRTPANLPNFLGAITLYNPNALATFRGTPPNVCGLDTNMPAVPFATAKASDCVKGSGDGPDAVAIAVHDDRSVTDIVAAVSKSTSRVIGTDGNGGSQFPSVYNVTTTNPTGQRDLLTAADIVELSETFQRVADYIYDGSRWYDGDGRLVGAGGWGSTAAPSIVVIRPPAGTRLNINGNLVGVGILIIDGQVKFGGTFNYAGLVMITRRGDAQVSVEMAGTPLVMGAMVAANPYSTSTSMLDLRGTSDVFFSRQAVAYAEEALSQHAKFETVFYMEKKPNAADVEIH
jgi:hypothetical protein